jgi:hypothetical protein
MAISQLIKIELQPDITQSRYCIPQDKIDELERRVQTIKEDGRRNQIPKDDIVRATQQIEAASPTAELIKTPSLDMAGNNYFLIAVQRHNTGDMVNIEYNIRISQNNYILDGIILRSGDITDTGYNGGHYRYLKVINERNAILYDDSVVKTINDRNLLNTYEFKKEGYLFLYKNANPSRRSSMGPAAQSSMAPAASGSSQQSFKYKYLKYKIKYHNLLKENNIE